MKLTPNQFEGLTQCQMEWATESDWLKQKDRFEDTICWSHLFICSSIYFPFCCYSDLINS